MKVTFSYFAQIRQKAGVENETIEVSDGVTVTEALKAAGHGEEFQSILFDESGALRPVILIMINDAPVTPDQVVSDGDKVQVFSPVAGG